MDHFEDPTPPGAGHLHLVPEGGPDQRAPDRGVAAHAVAARVGPEAHRQLFDLGRVGAQHGGAALPEGEGVPGEVEEGGRAP